jgi:acyl-CoA reductase-like NAD-dependent aldehyde dehydrogenase
MALSDAELEAVVTRVVGELLRSEPAARPSSAAPAPPAPSGREPLAATGRNGLFGTVDEAVAAASAAQRVLARGGVGLRKRAIAAIREMGVATAEELARHAHEETGLGRVRDKIAKNEFAAAASLGVEDLEPRAFAGEHGLTVEDWLPWGVVASITPTNSPSAFMVNHGITMLAGGNAVAFNCHPGCKWTSMRTVELMNQAVVAAGGPDNLMTGVVAPTLETARELVQHRDVAMLCITGGAELVRDAFGTGKRVIAAGPGLPVSVVDETADPRWAAEEIFRGAVFENTILCIGEKAVVVADRVYQPLLDAFADLPARVLDEGETERVFNAVIDTSRPGHAVTRREFVGRDAEVLLGAAGIESRKPVGLLVAPVDRTHPLFAMEQFCPFLPVVRARDSDEAIDVGIEVEGGNRHTAMIYSNFPPNVERFTREVSCVVSVVNGCSLRGLGVDGEGYPGFAIGTVTGEGITAPRHFVQARRVARIR